MEWITENGEWLAQMVASVVGLFAIIATITPNESDNKAAQFLLDLVNKLGMNVGKAKNG